MSNGFQQYRARIDGADICVEGSNGGDWRYVALLEITPGRNAAPAIVEALYDAGYLVDMDCVDEGRTVLTLRKLQAVA